MYIRRSAHYVKRSHTKCQIHLLPLLTCIHIAYTNSTHLFIRRLLLLLCEVLLYYANTNTNTSIHSKHNDTLSTHAEWQRTLCRSENCWCLMSTSREPNFLWHSRQASCFQSVWAGFMLGTKGAGSAGTGMSAACVLSTGFSSSV